MSLLAISTGLILLAPAEVASSVAWVRDYSAAFTQAEEQNKPVLLFFRTDCGAATKPGTVDEQGRPVHETERSDCDLMQQDVWESAAVVELTNRFVAVLIDGGDQSLSTRYQVVRVPTTLVSDPWGNEVLRASGYLAREKVQKLLAAMPTSFAGMARAGKVLKSNPADFGALVEAANFYEAARLPQVVERFYGLALLTPRTATPLNLWRQTVIARGMNLLVGLDNPGGAAAVFEAEVAAEPEGAGSDALLLGVVNARLQQGKRKEAEAAARTLAKSFPKSPYTARARQNLDAVTRR